MIKFSALSSILYCFLNRPIQVLQIFAKICGVTIK